MQKLWVIILVLVITSLLKFRMKSHIHISVNVTWKLSCNAQMPFIVCLAVQLRVYFLSYLLLSYHFLSLSLGLQYQRWPHFYWCIFNIYIYIYWKWWLPDWSHVCFLWLIALLHHWSSVIGWFVDWEVVCIYSSALTLFLSISDSCCCPLASQILCTCPPDLFF